MSKTAIIYGSTTGNTEMVAIKIQKQIPGSEVMNASNLTPENVALFDNLILGSSTWGLGELQDDWIIGVEVLKRSDLAGKKIALFGLGDQSSYPDTFVDGMGLIFQSLCDSGAQFVGRFPDDDFSFNFSLAYLGNEFVGLPIDFENQNEMTDGRIERWVKSLGL